MPQRQRAPSAAAHASSCCQPSALFAPRQRATSRPAASSATAMWTRLCASTPIVIIPPSPFPRHSRGSGADRTLSGRTTGSYQVTPQEPGAGATGHMQGTGPLKQRVSPPRRA